VNNAFEESKEIAMSNILRTYYQCITLQLRSEVDFINAIFKHQG